jgi:hypothetical protein
MRWSLWDVAQAFYVNLIDKFAKAEPDAGGLTLFGLLLGQADNDLTKVRKLSTLVWYYGIRILDTMGRWRKVINPDNIQPTR